MPVSFMYKIRFIFSEFSIWKKKKNGAKKEIILWQRPRENILHFIQNSCAVKLDFFWFCFTFFHFSLFSYTFGPFCCVWVCGWTGYSHAVKSTIQLAIKMCGHGLCFDVLWLELGHLNENLVKSATMVRMRARVSMYSYNEPQKIQCKITQNWDNCPNSFASNCITLPHVANITYF